MPLQPEFEHAILAVDGPVRVGGFDLTHRQMRYLEPGRDSVDLVAARDSTVLLIGGEPFTESLVMWWNFIGRSHDDIEQAREDWEHAASDSVRSRATTVSSSPPHRCRVSGSRRGVDGSETDVTLAGARPAVR